jgi:hypothetical protein
VRVRPVVNDAATVVDAVAESMRETLLLHNELDVDVYRLGRTEPDLVARAFGPSIKRAAGDAAARVLQSLADTRFPAERCPTDSPVLALGDGRHVLCEYVEPSPAPRPGFVLSWCGGLLGRLANRSADDLPMIARPLALDLWSVAYERMTAQPGHHPLPRPPRPHRRCRQRSHQPRVAPDV